MQRMRYLFPVWWITCSPIDWYITMGVTTETTKPTNSQFKRSCLHDTKFKGEEHWGEAVNKKAPVDKVSVTKTITGTCWNASGPVKRWVVARKEVCSTGNPPVLPVSPMPACVRLQGGPAGTKNKMPPSVVGLCKQMAYYIQYSTGLY